MIVNDYPFIKSSVESLGSRIVRDLPLMIFQSRESPPQHMEVAIPFRDPTGNPFNSRISSSGTLAPADVMLRSEIAQAIWFMLDQQVLPSPRKGRAFQDALLAMTGKTFFEL